MSSNTLSSVQSEIFVNPGSVYSLIYVGAALGESPPLIL
jgi:hypothetical protein